LTNTEYREWGLFGKTPMAGRTLRVIREDSWRGGGVNMIKLCHVHMQNVIMKPFVLYN
jgi:hypothetical protein